jgi:hypothetical protein
MKEDIQMSKRINKRLGIIATTGLIVCTAFLITITFGQTGKTDRNGPPAFVPAPQTTVDIDDAEWSNRVPLRALVQKSSVVVVGEVVGNRCITDSRYQVVTNYSVRVHEVLKGDVEPNRVLTVSQPGGLTMRSDGKVIRAKANAVRLMENGSRFVMLLKKDNGNGDIYTPVNGSQGLYRYSPNRETVTQFVVGGSEENATAFMGTLNSLVRIR